MLCFLDATQALWCGCVSPPSCLPKGLQLVNSLLTTHNVDGVHTVVLCQGDDLTPQHRGGSSLKQELSLGDVVLTEHAIDCHRVDLQDNRLN